MCPLVQRTLVLHLSVGNLETMQTLRAEFIRRLFSSLVVKESGYGTFCHFAQKTPKHRTQ